MKPDLNSSLTENFNLRQATPSDHTKIIAVLVDWWDGRDLTWMVPRLFLNHFYKTSIILEKENSFIAFLIGFLSPSKTDEGYIHFCGVHPNYRGMGIGSFLYESFFTQCRQHDRHIVRACTSPVNRESIRFHQKIGFNLVPGDADIDGLPVHNDYNKPGDPKVLFRIKI